MKRKVFISFLGTGKYKKCKYSSSEKGESKVVEFVQEAIMDLYCKDFGAEDIAYFFLTKEAERKHWKNLKQAIGEKLYQVVPIKNVSEGDSEKEIWKIFDLLYTTLNKEDEVILDVTHGFRSLPMLSIVLLYYAKSLKNIKVDYILYGAFEGIGVPAYQIDEKIPDPEKRVAPLFDLTAFSAIQSWTFAAESFIKTGNTNTITSLSLENIKPILKESKGADIASNNIRNLMKALEEIEIAINNNRGKVINDGNWIQYAKEYLHNLRKREVQIITPLEPILEQIENKLNVFDEYTHWE
ncbi:MAG TPA: TIGR02221 family CRISPR-associated protein, partial [Chitinophagaceae bacterium]|nr:TIGR02221 family CRISPR-associated protein [Chitinophagaceae bacterium]